MESGNWTVQNIGTGRYISGNIRNDVTVNTTTEAEEVIIVENSYTADGGGHINIKPTNGNNVSLNLNGANTASILGWAPNNGGSELSNSEWKLVDDNAIMQAMSDLQDIIDNKGGFVYLVSNRNASNVAQAEGTNTKVRAKSEEVNYAQIWQIKVSGEGYTLRSMDSGKYLQGYVEDKAAITLAESAVTYYICPSTVPGKYLLSSTADYSGHTCLHDDNNGKVVGWGTTATASVWGLEAVEDALATELLERICMTNFAEALAANGGLVQLICAGATDRVAEEVNSQTLANTKSEEAKYSQIWKLTTSGEGYTLCNMESGKYLQGYIEDDQAITLGEQPVTYYIKPSPAAGKTETCLVLSSTADYSDHTCLHKASNNKVVGWTVDDENSAWMIKAAEGVAIRDFEQRMAAKEAGKIAFAEAIAANYGYVRFVTDQANGYVIQEDESHKLVFVPYEEGNMRQMWKVIASGTNYNFQNLATGRYIDRGTDAATTLTTNTAAYASRVEISDEATALNPLFNIYHADPTTNGWYYDGTDSHLQLKEVGDGKGWGFSVVPAADTPFATLTAGKVYRIQNVTRPGYIIHNADAGTLYKTTSGGGNAQYWQLLKSTDGTGYYLKNIATGKYIGSAGALDTRYPMADEGFSFSLIPVSGTPYYYIGETETEGLHASNHDDGKLLRYYFTDAASQWYFEEATAEELADFPLLRVLVANDGLVRLIGNRNANKSAADINGSNTIMAARNDSKVSQIWHITSNGDGYSIRNMEGGQYLQGYVADRTPIKLAANATTYYIKPSTTKEGQFVLSSTSDYFNHTCLHDDSGNNRIVGWNLGADESQWTLDPVTNVTLQELEMRLLLKPVLDETLAANNGLVHITTDRENGYVLADAGASSSNALTFVAPEASDLSQLWIMAASGTGYTLKNVETGRYVSLPTDKFKTLSTSATSAVCNVAAAPTATLDNIIFTLSNTASVNVGMHYRVTDGAVITNSTTIAPGSAFRIVAAEGVTVEEVATSFYVGEGWSIPETGKYYHIYNGYWTDDVITEESNKLTVPDGGPGEGNKAQAWLMTSDSNGKFSFKNLSTNNYIQSQNTNVAQYTTGASEVTFTVSSTTSGFNKWYNIVDTDGDALKMENRIVANNSLSSEVTQSYWRFKEVNTVDGFAHVTKTLDELINNHNGIVIVRSKRNGELTKAMAPKADASGLHLETLGADLTDEANWNQVWILQRTNNVAPYTYTFRNLGSGKYIQSGLAMGGNKHNFYIQAAADATEETKTEGTFHISKGNTFDASSNSTSLNEQSGGVGWWHALNDIGSDWYIEPVEGITLEQVKEHLNIPTYSAPANGKYYKIVSRAYGHAITVQPGGTNMKGQADEDFPSQWWKVTVSGSNYTFQNVATQTYIQGDPGQSNNFRLGESAVNFVLAQTDDHYGIHISGNGRGFHESSSQSNHIVSWNYEANASRWYFQEITLADEDFAEAERYAAWLEASNTAEEISDAYLAFFTDASATTLAAEYQAMTDDELRAAMSASAIPSALQEEAVKVKNNSWHAWEKKFRVANYTIYSKPGDWTGRLGTSAWGVINNPTGVVAEKGDVVYVVVGTDIPDRATLTLEARANYTVNYGATQSITLKKGLNALPCANNASHIYVRYESANDTEIASYPSLNIHVIGGRVHGYIDNAKHTDADWVDMLENGLFWAGQTDLLGHYAQMHIETTGARNNGDRILPIIDLFDWYVHCQLDIMGVTAVPDSLKDVPGAYDAYEDLYPKKVNNHLLAIGKPGIGLYGGAYHIGLGGDGNFHYESLKERDASVWAPAHEYGHVNQGTIHLAASTEVSNNFYSNMTIYKGGNATSRGWNMQEMQRHMAEGNHQWPKICTMTYWLPTQMYYSLYLYYHAAENDPLFYQKLFKLLRANPLNAPTGDNGCTGDRDYLHFACMASDAAEEDLSDFFEYWGFFAPVDSVIMASYSSWKMTTTQAMIDEAKEYMARHEKKCNPSMVFIDDRSVVSYKADGVTPKDPFGGYPVASCQTDFPGAQYTAFQKDEDAVSHSNPNGLAYTISGNTVTLNTDATNMTEAAGIKFYDESGNLVYIASQTEFTIPETLASSVDHSKTIIALTDGTTMPLYDANDPDIYLMTIHHGNGKTTTRYTKGADDAMLDGTRDGKNAVAMIEDDNVPESLAATNNVAVNGVVRHLVLTDKVDFKLPADYTAKNITYKERYLYEGWNTLCLPFAITKSDLGEGAKIEVLDQAETSEDILYFVEVDGVAAGQPCLVWMPGENASWSYEKGNDGGISFKGSPDIEAEGFYMNGNFKKENIGAGHYKLNTAGTAFGVTTANGVSHPFRAYVSAENGGNVRTLRVMHRDAETTTDITVPALESLEGGVCYDLQGRKVKTPKRGKIYILGGRKVFFK